MKPTETLAYFTSRQQEMLDLLMQWVRMESPTTDKALVDQFGEEIASQFGNIGMSVDFDIQGARGNHLVGRWIGKGPKILLIGHLDTVWDAGTLEKMPARTEGDLAFGPGIFDMKAGIAITFFALQLLREHGLHHSNVTLLLNTDEEEGSETSRALIEREATGSACALVLEPAGPKNGLKTKRRGVGQYTVTAHGKSAHAGVDPEKGINAIEELAHQILEIQSWNRQRAGITATVGIIGGGTRTNVVPAEAHLLADVRCDGQEDTDWIKKQFAGLRAKHPNARLEVDGDVNRPPLVRNEKNLALYHEAEAIAASFGYPVSEYWTGGGSDGNFTSAIGVPTLDGFGAEGEGAHALHEQIVISSLPKRANLLYHLLRNKIQ